MVRVIMQKHSKQIRDLNHLETQFPIDQPVYVETIKVYLEQLFDRKVSSEDVLEFLILKGYKKIVEEVVDDLDIDDLLENNSDENLKVVTNIRLSYDDNSKLLAEYQNNNDQEAYEQLFLINLNLVRKEALKYSKMLRHTLSEEDLIQEGMIGLVTAINRFDFNRGTKFSTYATLWIRQKIIRAIHDTGHNVRVPVYKIEEVNRMRKCERQYIGVENAIEQICDEISITVEEYEDLKKIEQNYFHMSSLNTVVSLEDGDTELLDFIGNENAELLGVDYRYFIDPMQQVINSDESIYLKSEISRLKDREAQILLLRFGFIGDKVHTLEEIGQMIGVTRERIRQIENNALKKLKLSLRDYKKDDFV